MLGVGWTFTGTHFHALTEVDDQNGQAKTESKPSKILFNKIFDFCDHKVSFEVFMLLGGTHFSILINIF